MTFDLLTTDLAALLARLSPDTRPDWGRMTAQNMVEHLSGTMRISNGKAPLDVNPSPERIQAGRVFLFSDEPMPRDLKVQGVPADPPPHRFPDLQTAIAKLLQEVDEFHRFWESPPAELPKHPRFGPLDKAEWVRFHNKHMTHHLTQFALLP